MSQGGFINLANRGVRSDVFEKLQAFLDSLFVPEVAEAKSTSIFSCICHSTRKCPWVSHLGKEYGCGGALES